MHEGGRLSSTDGTLIGLQLNYLRAIPTNAQMSAGKDDGVFRVDIADDTLFLAFLVGKGVRVYSKDLIQLEQVVLI